jgi:hypothetical protein
VRGGFATYSLLHQGPCLVRNHMGVDYKAALLEGPIEHARAMAGRPLNGQFVLRVWDEDGVDFSAVEDIQIILDYGYWTRSN